MKRFEVKTEKNIGGNVYFIRPFGAFTSANLSGELMSVITPVLATIAPVFANAASQSGDSSFLDHDAEIAAPAIANALSNVSGDKIESLLRKLLTKHGNISVQISGEREAQPLTDDMADELFCGDTQDMFILAFEVVKANYSGFFGKIAGRFGKQIDELIQTGQAKSQNTES